MRTREEHQNVASELREVDELLEALPTDRVLERMSLERRQAALQMEVGGVAPSRLRRRLRLTFRGRPVVGSKGFFSDFASEATGKLTESVKAITAGMRGQLNYMGPIPGGATAGLLITGTARGSFGFEFEVPDGDQISIRSADDMSNESDLSETEAAIGMMRRLLEVASSLSDDDALAEIVDEVHPRSIKKVKEFLDVLHERDALCALEFDGQTFRLADRGQLERSRLRLDDANIHEGQQVFEGEVQGVLPKSRTFEFKVAGKMQVVRAKIGQEIDDPDVLNREYLHRPSRVTLQVTTVGQGRPRYILQSLPDLGAETASDTVDS